MNKNCSAEKARISIDSIINVDEKNKCNSNLIIFIKNIITKILHTCEPSKTRLQN